MIAEDVIARPMLTDVTLVAVTSVALQPTIDALMTSLQRVRFAKALLLTDKLKANVPDMVECREIRPLESRAAYSKFMLHDLADHIDTTHALCVQWDGYVINGWAWTNTFMNYDYIGAIWPQFSDAHRVGNGGFSLRSRRLLKACQQLHFDEWHAEDVVIGRVHRGLLENRGISFAPESVAAKFSYERTEPTGREFGFHGAYNLLRYLSRAEAVSVFGSLDPTMLTNSERREVLAWALKRGRFRLAGAMLRARR